MLGAAVGALVVGSGREVVEPVVDAVAVGVGIERVEARMLGELLGVGQAFAVGIERAVARVERVEAVLDLESVEHAVAVVIGIAEVGQAVAVAVETEEVCAGRHDLRALAFAVEAARPEPTRHLER